MNLHYNKLREAVRFWTARAFSYYLLQTFWLLVVAFVILATLNSLLAVDRFVPKLPEEATARSEAFIDALLGTIGSLRCGATGIVIGTITGAVSGTFGYRQKMQDAERKAQESMQYRNNIVLLIQIIKLQTWFIIGAVILTPLSWLILTKFNTRFFTKHEQILWLYALYLTIGHLSKMLILGVLLLYTARIVWRLFTIKPFRDTSYLSQAVGSLFLAN